MAFVRVCDIEDLWVGEMRGFDVQGQSVLIVHYANQRLAAYDGRCPHQHMPLADGEFVGGHIICASHRWEFDAATGQGVNPRGCRLRPYTVRVHGDAVEVDLETAAMHSGAGT